jgi:predicted permease
METLWQDLRYTLRLIRQRPGYTAVAILTLALGIGATTTIFTIADAVLFRPLPFRAPDRLVEFWNTIPSRQMTFPGLSPAALQEWRKQEALVEGIEGYNVSGTVLTGGEEPELVQAAYVTPGLFSFLGAAPKFGRSFTPEDVATGAERVAVISHGLWQRRFGGEPAAIGKQLRLGEENYTIVGVTAPTFRFPLEATRVWIPLAPDSTAAYRPRTWRSIARLKPGLSLTAAQERVKQIGEQLDKERPIPNGGSWAATLQSFDEMRAGEPQRTALKVLFGAVAFVLLIACVNTANLMLAQTSVREREIAIRAALGAQRFRLIRQMLTESAMLSLGGGIFGIIGALWGVDLLTRMLPREVAFYNYNTIGVDLRVLTFAIVASLATGLLFGMMPAIRGSRINLTESLKGASRSATGSRGHHRLRYALIALELGLSLVLLAGAGLLANSFIRVVRINPGFRTENLLSVELQLARAKASTGAQEDAFFKQLTERVAALPGVQGVTTASGAPPQTGIQFGDVEAEGHTPTKADKDAIISFNRVAENYFGVIGTQIKQGRAFTAADVIENPNVVILNESYAKYLFPDGNAIGKRWRIGSGPNSPWFEVVGVVGNTKDNGLRTGFGTYGAYYPFGLGKNNYRFRSMLVRTTDDPTPLIGVIKSQVWAIDKDQPITKINTVDSLFSESISQQRFNLLLMGVFAVVALLLAGSGIYGVINYTVSQRTHEIGIRCALGAQRADIIGLVIRQGVAPLVLGTVLGLGGALALTRYIKTLLYEVSPYDPLTLAAVVVLLAAVALVACYAPARRATKVDPLVALRYE